MRYVLCLLALLFCFCGTGGTGGGAADIPNVLTLELSFGGGGLPEEYLLAMPADIGVMPDGRILVLDENRIKVYNAAGKPLRILGGPGQGPGEFEYALGISVAPDGSAAVVDAARKLTCYSPELELARTRNVRLEDVFKSLSRPDQGPVKLMKTVPAGKGRALFRFDLTSREAAVYRGESILAYEFGDSLIELDRMVSKTWLDLPGEGYGQTLQWREGLLYVIAGGGKAVWRLPDTELLKERENPAYTLFSVSLNGLESGEIRKKTVSRPYAQVLLADSLKEYYITFGEEPESETEKRIKSKVRDIVKDDRYLPPLRALRADAGRIFAFTNSTDGAGNVVCDLFDAGAMTFLRQVTFPFVPSVIRNGRAYSIRREKDAFPQIEVYTVDESVYREG